MFPTAINKKEPYDKNRANIQIQKQNVLKTEDYEKAAFLGLENKVILIETLNFLVFIQINNHSCICL